MPSFTGRFIGTKGPLKAFRQESDISSVSVFLKNVSGNSKEELLKLGRD